MSTETTPLYSSEADTEPLPTIDEILTGTEPLLDSFDTRKERTALILKMSSMVLAPVIGLGIGTILAENKAAISMNYTAITAFSAQNDEMSAIASGLAGMPIRVDCDDASLVSSDVLTEDGQSYVTMGQVVPFVLPFDTYVSSPVTMLRESVCDTITDFAPIPDGLTLDDPRYIGYLSKATAYADAVGVLLHESEHIKQVHNEAEATCNAYQKLEGALVDLGIDEDTANRATLISSYRLSGMLMDSYLSDECTPGGEYDLGIGDTYVHPSAQQ